MSVNIKQGGELIKIAGKGGGGGAGGTSNYADLENKPSINGKVLQGSMTSTNLGITWSGTKAQYELDKTEIPFGTLVNITDDYDEGDESCSEVKQDLTKFADEGYVAKNLIPHPYAYNFPYTYNGITFDEIGGGCLRLNGTNANANNYCNFTSTVMQGAWVDKLVDGKTYCYSVEFVSGSGTISAYINNGQKDLLAMRNFSNTNRATFVYEKGSELTVAFYIPTNQTVNNLVIRPMIVEVDAKGNYPTRYTMYAPSNTDLGSDVTSLKSSLTKIFKVKSKSSFVALSGSWASGAPKTINMDISDLKENGYKVIGIISIYFSITANGATGYSDWLSTTGDKGFNDATYWLQFKNTNASGIDNLSKFNYTISVLYAKESMF